ncbi:cytochrome c peroxidase [Reichenbachiella faecimaris]|uniref:Cytochrome c peroxidase n=1 Tax=Reichenbachiella faecimaris TaxID=692418 RepID=A0A1W2GJI0_REIFA|nr:cytochrome c peroxidase [Reichenbachiella faecimaris]SMD36815.1 cytochrome c peroxidase [Reichenbachiella faecimaris]
MILRFGILLIGLNLLLSCSEDTQINKPTPYEFIPPEFFGDRYEIPADNSFTVEGIALGRNLFYEKQLSRNSQVSCGSCHQQSKAFTDGAKFSIGLNGELTGRSSMSLVNLLWQTKFFWDGRVQSLEEQALQPIQDHIEMDLTLEEAVERLSDSDVYPQQFLEAFETEEITSDLIAKALGQFMRTLVSSNSKYDQHLQGEDVLTDQEKLGMDLFFTHPEPNTGLRGGNCGDCHLNILTAGNREGYQGFHNNGIDSEESLEDGLMIVTGKATDKGKFKAPSLRNIALTAPYMHDGRMATLEEVLDHYNENIQTSTTLDVLITNATNNPESVLPVMLGLTEEEKQAIIAFLHTLTDEIFINDEAFSDPFEN